MEMWVFNANEYTADIEEAQLFSKEKAEEIEAKLPNHKKIFILDMEHIVRRKFNLSRNMLESIRRTKNRVANPIERLHDNLASA
jgi:hypothetical protein